MRQKKKRKISSKLLMTLLSIFCIVLLGVSMRFKSIYKPFNAIAGVSVVPMQKGINAVGRTIKGQFDRFENIEKLQEENKKLQEKIDALDRENKNFHQEKGELTRLQELYQLDEKFPEYEKVGARIISKGAGNWFNVFTIDKGSADGIQVDMNVIAGTGLVGIVTQVDKHYATVRAIIDDTSNVSAAFSRTSDQCQVIGSQKQIDNGYIQVINIDKDAKVIDGDELITSDGSSKFLPGITIGYVSDIKMESSNLVQSANVTPVVDFKHLREVLVIKQIKRATK